MPKKIDSNHGEIVRGLRSIGARVQSLAAVGKGCPDLLIAFRGRWIVAEVKDGEKSPSRQRLTMAEQEWHEQFSIQAPVHVWSSLDEALAVVREM